ncbi:MAG: hypothetical protein ACRDHF_14790 [Tepidiformaceae bacterium]
MALVMAVVVVALLAASATVRRALPSESLIAFATMGIGVVLLFQLDRLG